MSVTTAAIIALATCTAQMDVGMLDDQAQFRCNQQQVIVNLQFVDPSAVDIYLREAAASARPEGYYVEITPMMKQIFAIGQLGWDEYLEHNDRAYEAFVAAYSAAIPQN